MILATLDEVDLPPQFSYNPYVPSKRFNTTKTANAVITQHSTPQIVHGEGTISWRIPGAFPEEFTTLYGLYNTNVPVLYRFTGYWGEVLDVYFASLDSPKVRGRIFEISGMFQVMAVIADISPTCNEPAPV